MIKEFKASSATIFFDLGVKTSQLKNVNITNLFETMKSAVQKCAESLTYGGEISFSAQWPGNFKLTLPFDQPVEFSEHSDLFIATQNLASEIFEFWASDSIVLESVTISYHLVVDDKLRRAQFEDAVEFGQKNLALKDEETISFRADIPEEHCFVEGLPLLFIYGPKCSWHLDTEWDLCDSCQISIDVLEQLSHRKMRPLHVTMYMGDND